LLLNEQTIFITFNTYLNSMSATAENTQQPPLTDNPAANQTGVAHEFEENRPRRQGCTTGETMGFFTGSMVTGGLIGFTATACVIL
jgi:hypothetical protein